VRTRVVPFAAGGPVDTVARAAPDGYTLAYDLLKDLEPVGTAGSRSSTHIAGIHFANEIGAKLPFIPYKGTGPAMQDLMGGQADMMVDQLSNSIPQVKAGRITGYAITAKERSVAAPDVPTVDEAGLPGPHIAICYGIWAPRGTPREAVAKLNQAVRGALADPDTRKRLGPLGREIVPPERQSPEALGAHRKAEIEKWWPIIRAAGIKLN
jgi:tripartite-type tricarboxylate transporter receptor subunit TctC